MSDRLIATSLSMRGIGYHSSAWRDPGVPPLGPLDIKHMANLARIAERGLFDMLFLGDWAAVVANAEGRNHDGVAELEPVTLLAALSQHTTNIGLVATASTTLHQPYQIARQFASLDHMSNGRAGWNVVTSSRHAEARNFSYDELPPKEERYERAEEAIRIVMSLWQSWEPDAFVCDRETGIYFDPKKMHATNIKGKYFRSDGPLNVARCPQGRPLIVQAGGSPRGIEMAARYADMVYTAQNELSTAQDFYKQMKAAAVGQGRDPDTVKIMPGVLPIIGRTRAEAQDKYRRLQDMLDPVTGVEYLYQYFGDLKRHDIDGPVPEISTDVPVVSRAKLSYDMARKNNWSIRMLMKEIAITRTHNVAIGSVSDVADLMEEWFTKGACDGFNINPALSPEYVEDFVDLIVPELQRRGLYKTAYKGTLLRDNLGLPPV